jgi:hypothetical protein
MAENPATWDQAEKIISRTLDQAQAAHEAGMCGWTTPKQIAEALRSAHLLRDRSLAEVTISFNWREKEGNRTGVAIHWKPGAENALATAIICQVKDEPVPLELDGQLFVIQRVHGRLEDNEAGGVTIKPL